MAEQTSELIFKLIDGVTESARAIGRSMTGMTDTVNKNKLAFESLGRQAQKNFKEAKHALIETSIAAGAFALALKKPIEMAMEMSGIMKTLQIASGKTDETMEDLGKSFSKLGQQLDLADEKLAQIAVSLPSALRKSNTDLMQGTELVGKYVKAFKVDPGTVAKMVTPLLDKFGKGGLTTAFGILGKAAAEANIPIEDLQGNLADFLTITTSFGQTGTKGMADSLATVVAMTKAGATAGDAYAGIDKILERVSKKGFGKAEGLHLNVEAIKKQALASGEDPIQAVLSAVFAKFKQKAGGNQAKFNELMVGAFGVKGDIMAKYFLQSQKYFPETKRLMEGSGGFVNKALVDRTQDWGEAWKALGTAIGEFGQEIGEIVGSRLAPLMRSMTDLFKGLKNFINEHGNAVFAFVAIGGGLLGLAQAVNVARLAFWGLKLAFGVSALAPMLAGISSLVVSLGPLVTAAAAVGLLVDALTHLDSIWKNLTFQGPSQKHGLGVLLGFQGFKAPEAPGKSLPLTSLAPGGIELGKGKGSGGFKPISGNASDIPGMSDYLSGTERATRGQPIIRPLDSIDRKMSTLIEHVRRSVTRGSSPATFGTSGLGGTPGSGGGGGSSPGGGPGGRAGGGSSSWASPGGSAGGARAVARSKADQSVDAQLIRKLAKEEGVDPDVAVAVARSEGLGVSWAGGDKGSSFGAFQAHFGGMARGMMSKGQGDVMAAQGINAKDPAQKEAVWRWQLRYAKKHGWGEWYGAKRVGIGRWQGLRGGGPGNVPVADGSSGSGSKLPAGQTVPGLKELEAATLNIPGVRKRVSAENDQFHHKLGYDSKHTHGLAFDQSLQNPAKHAEAAEYVRGILRGAGLSEKDFMVKDEYAHPSGASTGGHIHTQFNSPAAAERFRKSTTKVDTSEVDHAISKFKELHHLAKNIPHAKTKVAHDVHDDHTYIKHALNRRYASAEIRGS